MTVATVIQPGAGSVTFPVAGTLEIEVWGGGASGARRGRGGGGGAYARVSSLAVAAGQTLYWNVGGVAIGSVTTTGTAGNPTWARLGTNSSSGLTTADGALAAGGSAGTSTVNGAGGTTAASIGTTEFAGGAGGNSGSGTTLSGGGGGGAGSAANGGNASGLTGGDGGEGGNNDGGPGNSASVGGTGISPGGGGGSTSNATGTGGLGARGELRFTFVASGAPDVPWGPEHAEMQPLFGALAAEAIWTGSDLTTLPVYGTAGSFWSTLQGTVVQGEVNNGITFLNFTDASLMLSSVTIDGAARTVMMFGRFHSDGRNALFGHNWQPNSDAESFVTYLRDNEGGGIERTFTHGFTNNGIGGTTQAPDPGLEYYSHVERFQAADNDLRRNGANVAHTVDFPTTPWVKTADVAFGEASVFHANEFMYAHIGAAFFFDDLVSDVEVQRWEGWGHWTLFGNGDRLDINHPYKFSPPEVTDPVNEAIIEDEDDTVDAEGVVPVVGAGAVSDAADAITAAGISGSPTTLLAIIGDSMHDNPTLGAGQDIIDLLSLPGSWTKLNLAVDGKQLVNSEDDLATVLGMISSYARVVVIIESGGNDIRFSGRTAEQIATDRQTFHDDLTNAGAIVLHQTLNPCEDFYDNGGAEEAVRVAVNALIRDIGAWPTIDPAADVALQNPANETYYAFDHIHWNLTGNARVASQHVQPVLDFIIAGGVPGGGAPWTLDTYLPTLAAMPRLWFQAEDATWSGTDLSALPNAGTDGGTGVIVGPPTQGATVQGVIGILFDNVAETVSFALGEINSGAMTAVHMSKLQTTGAEQGFVHTSPWISPTDGCAEYAAGHLNGWWMSTNGYDDNLGNSTSSAAFRGGGATVDVTTPRTVVYRGGLGVTGCRVDGEVMVPATLSDVAVATIPANDWHHGIGSPGDQPLNASYFVSLRWDFALTDAELEIIEGILHWGHAGTGDNLPIGHPYKSAPPTQPGSSPISGGAAIEDEADTTAAAGGVAVTGLVTVADEADSVGSTGQVLVGGAAVLEDAQDAGAGAGVVPVQGAAALTDAADSITGAATAPASGVAAITDEADIGAGAGVVPVAGQATLADGADAVDAEGETATGPSGGAAILDEPDTASGAGAVAVTGGAAAQDAQDATAAEGDVLVEGDAVLTDAEDAGAAAGGVGVQGTAAVSDEADTATGAAVAPVKGQAAIQDEADEIASDNLPVLHGEAAIVDEPDSAALAGTVETHGQAAIVDAPDTGTAAGVAPIEGDVAAVDATDAAGGAGVVPITGAGVAPDQTDTTQAAGGVAVKGAAVIADEADVAGGAAAAPVKGAAAIQDAADTATGAGVAPVAGAAGIQDAQDAGAAAGRVQVAGAVAIGDAADAAAAAGRVAVKGAAAIADEADVVSGDMDTVTNARAEIVDEDDVAVGEGVVPIAATAILDDGDDSVLARIGRLDATPARTLTIPAEIRTITIPAG